MFHWHLLPGGHFPPWTHANNTRHGGVNSKSTYSTNMAAGNLGQGALIFNDMNTSLVFFKKKNSKKVPLNSQQKYSKVGTWLAESHTARGWQQTNQVRVWTVATLLSCFVFLPHSPSPARGGGRGGGNDAWGQRASDQGFLAQIVLRLKRTQGLTRDQEQQLCRFLDQQEHERVRFSLQTELTFLYTSNHSILIFSTST